LGNPLALCPKDWGGEAASYIEEKISLGQEGKEVKKEKPGPTGENSERINDARKASNILGKLSV